MKLKLRTTLHLSLLAGLCCVSDIGCDLNFQDETSGDALLTQETPPGVESPPVLTGLEAREGAVGPGEVVRLEGLNFSSDIDENSNMWLAALPFTVFVPERGRSRWCRNYPEWGGYSQGCL